MISGWLEKGSQVLNSTKLIVSPSTPDQYALTKEILKRMEIKLSKQLGQSVDGLDIIINDISKQEQLEKSVLAVKQKYNNLVLQTQAQAQCMKQMIQSIIKLLKNIAKSLENQDLETPLKNLEVALNSFNKMKVDQSLQYYFKIFQALLKDYSDEKIEKKTQQHKEEMNLFKGLNKNLEMELLKSRNACTDLERRVNELHTKNQQMSEKIKVLQKLGAENLVLSSNKQKQKALEKENLLLDKIKNLEREKYRLERQLNESESEIKKTNEAMEVIRNNQDIIIQDMRKQISKKEASYESRIMRLCTEKKTAEQKIKQLQSGAVLLAEELKVLKQLVSAPRAQKPTVNIVELKERINDLEKEISTANKKIQSMINKEIMKNLFLGFEDQSKEWTVRRDIKKQIYLMLDIQQMKVEVKSEQRKWFGLF